MPDGAILVTADVVGLYPSIPHNAGLETLRRRLNERETSEIPTNDIVQTAEFVLKNIFFEFNGGLTLSDPEKLKNAIFEIPIIPRTLNINN